MNVSFGTQIEAAAAAHHLDPKLLAAVAAQETGGPGANSGRNIVGDGGHGHGLFQIDDRSWSFARTAAAMNPAKNAEMAATILEENLHRYGGDLRAALSAYNSGSPTAAGTKTTWGDGHVLNYADSVLRHYGAIARSAPPVTRAGAIDREPSLVEHVLASLHAIQTSRGLGVALPSAFANDQRATSGAIRTPAAQPTPLKTWAQVSEAGAKEGESADRITAELIDTSVVVADGDDDS